MFVERIALTNEENGPYIDAYIADASPNYTRKALLVFPGGAYIKLAPREGEPVAQAFMPYGYNTFVLHYTVSRKRRKPFPSHLIEATLAIKHIKDNADKYGIDPAEFYVVGFSAGGHLAASVATMWKNEKVLSAVEMPYGYNRVKGAMLIYPMVSPDYSNCETYDRAWGNLFACENPTPEQLNEAAIERHVDADSSPAFILHAFTDPVVDVRNALVLGKAYAEAGVPCEIHVYPEGTHGFSLANEVSAEGHSEFMDQRLAEWVRLAAEWAKTVKSE